jgi:hypothetical protein
VFDLKDMMNVIDKLESNQDMGFEDSFKQAASERIEEKEDGQNEDS